MRTSTSALVAASLILATASAQSQTQQQTQGHNPQPLYPMSDQRQNQAPSAVQPESQQPAAAPSSAGNSSNQSQSGTGQTPAQDQNQSTPSATQPQSQPSTSPPSSSGDSQNQSQSGVTQAPDQQQNQMPSSTGSSESQSQSGMTQGTSSGRSQENSTSQTQQPSSASGASETDTVAARIHPQTENGITYVCGGVGEEETAYMKKSARDYDLMLTFTSRTGQYLSNVDVAIKDAKGKEVLSTTCDSPILLVDLPRSGVYHVQAKAEDYSLRKTVHVKAKGHTNSVVMSWPRIREEEGVAEVRSNQQRDTSSGSSGGENRSSGSNGSDQSDRSDKSDKSEK